MRFNVCVSVLTCTAECTQLHAYYRVFTREDLNVPVHLLARTLQRASVFFCTCVCMDRISHSVCE